MSDKVRVIWTLTDGVVFRAPIPTLANDSAHGEMPWDLELNYGSNNGIDSRAVDYWARRTGGLRFDRVNDTVVITADDGRDERAQIKRDREALARDRLAFDRERARRR
jgi:hypothetical protein